MSRMTDLIDIVLLILNAKLANSAMFLSSWIEILSCCNTVT